MGNPERTDPRTPREWAEAAEAATLAIAIGHAQRYGCIDESGRVDVARCTELLKRVKLHSDPFRPGPLQKLLAGEE